MPFFIYNLIIFLMLPAIAIYMLHRIFISGKSKRSWTDQMGKPLVPYEICEKRPIWIHAVSVGESVAAAAVIRELKSRLPDVPVVMSTTTQTGQEMAQKFATDADYFIYFPFDLLPFVRESIVRVNPSLFASTDSDIWPNFLHVCKANGVKTALINGTISDSTFKGSSKIGWIYRWALSKIDRCCMQCDEDARRIVGMGADAGRVVVTGNCKADQALVDVSEDDLARLRGEFGIHNGTRIFVAGSTNPGEDAPVIDAYAEARKAFPDMRMILAPRQLERRGEICAMLDERGIANSCRSGGDSSAEVVVLDTFGELAKAYALADVAFVGGSLIPKGCHSLLQPVSCGKPVCFGPHTFKTRDFAQRSKSAKVGFEVGDGGELASQLIRLLSDNSELSDISLRCGQLMSEYLGASARTADELVRLYRS